MIWWLTAVAVVGAAIITALALVGGAWLDVKGRP